MNVSKQIKKEAEKIINLKEELKLSKISLK